MSSLTKFQFSGDEGFKFEVRVVGTTEEPWFVAADVCGVLDQPNVSQVCERLDAEEKCIQIVDTPGDKQNMLCINESGLYSLILTSRKPQAKKFKKWVTSEVLPTIRKTGKYLGNAVEVKPDAPKALTPVERIELMQKGVEFLKQLGQFTERDSLVYADATRNLTLNVAADNTNREWTISERIITLGYKPQANTILSAIGKAVAKMYRIKHNGQEPPKRMQYVEGAARPVNTYFTSDLDVMDTAIYDILADE